MIQKGERKKQLTNETKRKKGSKKKKRRLVDEKITSSILNKLKSIIDVMNFL